ncbi:QWRF motif-containing protein 7 isoform X2 [Abrus precatorius]|uniref:QWRF motif-containing protein 7 isoform X2 n=1 Tax=Abrus precatorius TaxID=3816 RepID=A0A8B8JNG1_ABRPR|nr:QWRF motif-containing protein 7 isoform X2 [Abrus precatorius]
MDKTARSLSARNQLTVVPPSPRLVRSRSGSSPAAVTTPEISSHRFSSSHRFTNVHRSKSTSKSRTNNHEGINMNIHSWRAEKNSPKIGQEQKSKDGIGKYMQRGVSHENTAASKRTTSTVKLPSAWALSPGRQSLGSAMGPKSPAKVNGSNGGVGGGVAKVLKYFKQRKVSSVKEEEYHRFRILHNKLLQWRFINARAQIAVHNFNHIAEIQLFSAWIRILKLRKMIIQKRNELQRVKHVMKLYQILNGELYLLTEWAQLERKNQEFVGRLTRKLSALSTTLPLTHGVKGDITSVSEAFKMAIEVMENIEPLVRKYQTQVERILYQVTELTTTHKQEEEYLKELLAIVPVVAALLDNERSNVVHLIQAKMESNTSDYPCCVAQSCV